VPVFLPAVAGHLDLRLPFRGAEDIHRDAVNLSGADHDAVRQVCPDMAAAILEDLRGPMALAAGKLAGREPHLADAVPDHPDFAWVLFPELPASVALAARLARQHAGVAPYIPDAARSAA
jgi:hypothetical protein